MAMTVGVRDRYDRGDLNLDGRVLATGATGSRGSDLALLRNTILQHPANSSGFLNYLVYDTRPGATTVP